MGEASDRVRRHSPEPVNRRIDRETRGRVWACASDPDAIDERIAELDREWDVERALFVVTSVNLLLGLAATARDRRWLPWPAAVAAFQLQHAVQGWSPPVSALRRLGVRTRQEIEDERTAPKALRGDFVLAPDRIVGFDPDRALEAATR